MTVGLTVQQAVFNLRATHLAMTCEDLGRALRPQVSRQTVSNWEDGTHLPTALHLAALSSLAKRSRAPAEVVAAFERALQPEVARP